MNRAPLPSVEQVRMLPVHHSSVVGDDLIDFNGHMNVLHYLDLAARGADRMVRDLGIDDAYRDERGLGIFTVEHHLGYHSELRLGDQLTVHGQVIACSAKVMHKMCYLLDAGRGRLANTLEIISVHVDLGTRRTAAFPEDVSAALADATNRTRTLGWAPPVCGAMSVPGQ
ncbi:MAG: thioesterase family protein [Nocardioides sp.]|nr:thioesterase family protein [Nocardioides sp.]